MIRSHKQHPYEYTVKISKSVNQNQTANQKQKKKIERNDKKQNCKEVKIFERR